MEALKCSCPGVNIHRWLKRMQMLRIALLVLFPEGQKNCYLCCLWCFLGEISALEINIEVKTPENCRFFVDEIDRGGLVKPSDLPYVICSLVWNIRLNSEAKSLFLSSKMHRSIFLNILHGQEIESPQYVNIL